MSKESATLDKDDKMHICYDKMHILVRPQTVPSLFHVCPESRDICLTQYRGFYWDGFDKGEMIRWIHLREHTSTPNTEDSVVYM